MNCLDLQNVEFDGLHLSSFRLVERFEFPNLGLEDDEKTLWYQANLLLHDTQAYSLFLWLVFMAGACCLRC